MYCISCKKTALSMNFSVRRTKQNGLMLVSNCAICGNKISRFIKNQELSGLLGK